MRPSIGSWRASRSPRSSIERKNAVERARGALHNANTGIGATYPGPGVSAASPVEAAVWLDGVGQNWGMQGRSAAIVAAGVQLAAVVGVGIVIGGRFGTTGAVIGGLVSLPFAVGYGVGVWRG